MAFRFFFVFFVLYIFPFPLSYVPYLGGWLSPEPLWRMVVPWTGAHVLHRAAHVGVERELYRALAAPFEAA